LELARLVGVSGDPTHPSNGLSADFSVLGPFFAGNSRPPPHCIDPDVCFRALKSKAAGWLSGELKPPTLSAADIFQGN